MPQTPEQRAQAKAERALARVSQEIADLDKRRDAKMAERDRLVLEVVGYGSTYQRTGELAQMTYGNVFHIVDRERNRVKAAGKT